MAATLAARPFGIYRFPWLSHGPAEAPCYGDPHHNVDVFVARQPILDEHQQVYGYELLFRAGVENAFPRSDPNQASSRVIADTYFLLGIESLTAGRRAFINMTRDLLVEGAAMLLPRDTAVVEVLETVSAEPDVVKACVELKRAGYVLALDDFVHDDRLRPLLDLADIVKVDVLATSLDEQRVLLDTVKRPGLVFLAEKVETAEAFAAARDLGYTYFQGYFFCCPVIVSGKDVPGFKVHYLQLLSALHRPELAFTELEDIIKRDLSLSYKLLRYVNSAYFARKRPIESIREGLMYLGENTVKTWVSVLALAAVGRDKPAELVAQAVIRAKFCELIAALTPVVTDQAFLTGLFSLMDAIMGRPLAEILHDLPLAEDIKHALLGGGGPLGTIHELSRAQERGDWAAIANCTARLGIQAQRAPALYGEAVTWGESMYRSAAQD